MSSGAKAHSGDSIGDGLQCATLVELLSSRAASRPDWLAYSFLAHGETLEASFTLRELDQRARAIAAYLQSSKASGGRALLLYASGLEFIAAFFGCLYAGVVAVPTYPPDPARLNRSLPRFLAIASDADPVIVLTITPILNLIGQSGAVPAQLASTKWAPTDTITADRADEWRDPEINGDTLAFLQYTSGSTATPKGVMVTHRNILQNERMIQAAFRHTENSTFVGWLPLFHDMGLIGNVLHPLFLGSSCYLMSPEAFLQKPVRWLQAISRYKGATSGGPNFAYDLCTRKVTEEERQALDLSSWNVAFNGSEPVRQQTLERFSTAFEPCGFRREAFQPCYGLAEATLIVSGGREEPAPRVTFIRSSGFKQKLALASTTGSDDAQTFVGCGRSIAGENLVIVDPDSLTRCSPETVGEIWVKGPHVAQGYWNRPHETAQTFQGYLADTGEGPFLRTGDLGFVQDDQLFIAGRIKDLIIIRGRNHYPQDIELTAERSHAALRPGSGAACSVEIAGEERLVIVQEVGARDSLDVAGIVEKIREAIAREHELQVYAVSLLKPGGIPKTSSGKIQRHACREGFLKESLDCVARWKMSEAGEVNLPDASATELPRTSEEIETWLVSEVARLLNATPSSLTQPAARLYLDSLMAIELTHRIEATLGVNLPMALVLESSSIPDLASQLLTQINIGPSSKAPALMSISKNAAGHPLSHGQRALWFLYNLAPESAAYNIVGAARIRSELDVGLLRRAFQRLIDRHGSLRTSFIGMRGNPVQQLKDQIEVCFESEDASKLDEESLNDRIFQEAQRPFILEQGSLLRVKAFTQSSHEHVLLFVFHHIAADLWSLGVLVHELGVFYCAEARGIEADLPPLEIDYIDWVHWQNERLAGDEGERLWQYWSKQMSGVLPVLNLPTDRPRPPVQSYSGATRFMKVEADLTRQLETLASANGTTLFVTLLAAFEALLHRYTGQEEILVGAPTAGRSRSELRDVVGYFVNPVVIRAFPSAMTAFRDFLLQVRKTALDAFEHQDYPFPLLVERLQPDRDPSRSPVFQVMFVWQKTHLPNTQRLVSFALGDAGARMDLGGLELESIQLEQRAAQLDLTMNMGVVEGELLASLEYNTDLYNAATIDRLLGHFRSLLESAVENPARRLGDLALLPSAERHEILVRWNETTREYPAERCIHHVFESQVEQSPDRVAIEFEARSLTYRELDRNANRLAHYLRSFGVRPDVLVGLCIDRSIEMVVGILGILKAGGAYVPLDAAYPKERLQLMLESAQVPVLLTQTDLVKSLPVQNSSVICIDADWERISGQSNESLVSGASGENLICVLYTSGSTGKPKGVMLRHGSLVSYADTMGANYEINAGDRVLQFCSISFDISVEEIFPCLTRGATLVLRIDQMLSVPVFLEKCNEWGITVVSLPTAYWHELTTVLDEQELALPPKLHTVVIAGEKALPEKLAIWKKYAPQRPRLLNTYGPAETTIAVTLFNLSDLPLKDAGLREVPIGRPITNARIYLLDQHLEPVPAGVSGEMYIGGSLVTRGYYGRADSTAERYVPNPFGDNPGLRNYRTGDLARYMPDGNIEFLGRIDHQVKIRGYRVEIEEIEWILGQHPAVRDNLVVAREDVPGDRRLVAYVVGDREAELSPGELRSYLKGRLPEYMVPSWFVLLESLPLSPNGKVDRRALPMPDSARPDLEGTFVGPRDDTEQLLARIWSEVLGFDHIGVYDNFFELGGHSLLATQLVSRVRQAFNLELPLRTVFETPTVAGLAKAIDASQPARNEPSASQTISRRSKSVDQQLAELEDLPEDQARSLINMKGRIN